MIQANELIINRYFELNGLIVRAVDFEGLNSLYDDIKNIKPIPLTEEWLLKFGFRHVMNNWYNLHANGNTFNVYLFEDGRYRVEIVSQSIGVFEFVHTLQNLYFALTNKELILNK